MDWIPTYGVLVKRFKREPTLFEELPNEMLVEIFSYLNGVDAVYAFSLLNVRFKCLLNNYVNKFNLRSISKTKFAFVTKQHDVKVWHSLCLSNDDHTSQQIEIFTWLFPIHSHMTQLRCLSLLHMKTKDVGNIITQIDNLPNLVSLSIGHVCGLNMQPITLPSLKRLSLVSCRQTTWLQNFHTLERLSLKIEYSCSHDSDLAFPSTLKHLKVFYQECHDGKMLRGVLRQMSQLTKLSLYDTAQYSPIPNGKIWEDLISSSLPCLDCFQFCFPFERYFNNPDGLSQAVDSFATPFYLLEKRCFVQCDQKSIGSYAGVLYSVPFAFTIMPINTNSFDTSISTLPISIFDSLKTNLCSKVDTILFNQTCTQPHTGFLSCHVHHLILEANLPTSWNFLLKSLTHLSIGSNASLSPSQFECLMKVTPNLHSLTASRPILKSVTENFSNRSICEQLSEKILSLTISHNYFNLPTLGIVSVRVLRAIVNIFFKKCQHLSLALNAHPRSLASSLRRMTHLRSLHIQWPYRSFSTDDPGTCWIQYQGKHIKSTNSHVNIDNENNHIYIWYGNQT